MRHLRRVSKGPKRAQSSLCTNIDNDFQAQLCFVFEVLTSFFLPILQFKQPEEPADETLTAGS